MLVIWYFTMKQVCAAVCKSLYNGCQVCFYIYRHCGVWLVWPLNVHCRHSLHHNFWKWNTDKMWILVLKFRPLIFVKTLTLFVVRIWGSSFQPCFCNIKLGFPLYFTLFSNKLYTCKVFCFGHWRPEIALALCIIWLPLSKYLIIPTATYFSQTWCASVIILISTCPTWSACLKFFF